MEGWMVRRLWVAVKVCDVIVSVLINLLLPRLMPGLGPPGLEPSHSLQFPPSTRACFSSSPFYSLLIRGGGQQK